MTRQPSQGCIRWPSSTRILHPRLHESSVSICSKYEGKGYSSELTSCVCRPRFVELYAFEPDGGCNAGYQAAAEDQQQRRLLGRTHVEFHQRRERKKEDDDVTSKERGGLVHEDCISNIRREAVIHPVRRHEELELIRIFRWVALECRKDRARYRKEHKEYDQTERRVLNVRCVTSDGNVGRKMGVEY